MKKTPATPNFQNPNTSVLPQQQQFQQFQFPSNSSGIQLLVVILDCNALEWGKRKIYEDNPQSSSNAASPNENSNSSSSFPSNENNPNTNLSFKECLEHTLLFLNSFLLAKSAHKVAIIGSFHNGSEFLFPNNLEKFSLIKKYSQVLEKPRKTATKILKKVNETNLSELFVDEFFSTELQLSDVSNQVIDSLKNFNPSASTSNNSESLQKESSHAEIASSLSQALLFINRAQLQKPIGVDFEARILVLQVSPDSPMQYVKIMNSVFCAQKMNVMIDACVLNPDDSPYLQQACFITGGIYFKPQTQKNLIQYLVNVFMANKSLRGSIQHPKNTGVDFRASCFDTKQPVDIGYVCSACLSIFQQPKAVCSTCGCRMPVRTL